MSGDAERLIETVRQRLEGGLGKTELWTDCVPALCDTIESLLVEREEMRETLRALHNTSRVMLGELFGGPYDPLMMPGIDEWAEAIDAASLSWALAAPADEDVGS